jgi:tetratricopeptide (TPR) repeat protein
MIQQWPRHIKLASFQLKAGAFHLVVLSMLVSFSYAAPAEVLQLQQSTDTPRNESHSSIQEFALKLGDDSFEIRERAMGELWKLGRVALPVLRIVEAGDDVEASERATELIYYISAGLLFDCPEGAKDLVLKFFQRTYDGKIIIAHNLIKLGQWKQVMHLGKLDADPKVQQVIAAVLWPQVQARFRRAIANKDERQIEEIIGLMGDTDLHMRTRAFYFASTGQVDQELKKVAGSEGEVAERWRIWLHRCSGNLKVAITEAERANESKTADLLRVLDGNALPWLERSATEGDAIYQWGCKLQQLRLEGKDAEAEVESRRWERIEAGQAKRSFVVRCLAVNGFRGQALNLLESNDANAAFKFYDIAEMPKQSLKALGIKAHEKPPYTDWVNKRIDELGKDSGDRGAAADQVMMLASFLHGRGEVQHAADVITPMMDVFGEQNEDWNQRVDEMLEGGMGSLALDFIKQKIELRDINEVDLAELVEKIIHHIEPAMRDCIWAHLTKRNGEEYGASLDQLGLLAGLLSDPDDQASKIHNELLLLLELDENEAMTTQERTLLIETLYQLCITRNDLNKASQMMGAYPNEGKAMHLAQDDMNYNLLRWLKVEPALAARAARQPDDLINLIKWHITLQKLGRHQQAEDLFDQAMCLSLGDPDDLIECGHYLHAAGYDHKAMELWALAAMISDFSDENIDDYIWAVTLLASNARSFYANGDWQKAWSISEAFARFIMRSSSVGTHLALKARYQAEFCYGMMMINQGSKKEGMRRLEVARQMIPGDGVLADDFFPALRNKIPTKIYNRWFDDSYAHIVEVCKDYPRSHNAHNTAAWLSSRAVRHLEEAYAHAQKAVSIRPNQGAYLDTMAEVWFAKGNRQKALIWSEKAIVGSISGAAGSPRELPLVYANYQQLSKQLQHFKNDPLPMKAR